MKKDKPVSKENEDFEKIKLLHELEVHQAELEAQSQELRASREEAQEALDNYAELYEFSPVGMLSLSRQSDIIECNMAAAELLGYPRAQLHHKDLRVFIKPAFHAAFGELLKEVLASSTKQYGELELCGKEGESIYCQLVGLSVTDSRTHQKQCRIALMDISCQKQKQDEMHELYLELRRVNEGLTEEIKARKKMEELLRQSETEYRVLFEATGHAKAIIEEDMTISRINKEFIEISGYSRAEIEDKKKLTEFVAEDDVGRITEYHRLRRVDQKMVPRSYEFHYHTKKGELRNGFVTVDLIPGTKKSIASIVDITERKQAEETLRITLERLGFAQRAAKTGFWDWDVATGKLIWSPEFYELFGLHPSAEASFETWLRTLHPDDREPAMARINRSIEKRISLENEYRILRPDGEERWISALGDTSYDTGGRPERMSGICIDITERKQVEETLRETRDYLEKLFEYANAPIIVWDPSFTINRFNHAFEHLTGRRATEVVGKALDILLPEDEREEAMTLIRRAVAGERWETVEIPILHADGTVKIVLWNSATLYAEDGTTPIAIIAQGQDITDRKRAEEELQSTHMKMRAAFDAIREPVNVVDRDYNLIEVNDALIKTHGLPDRESAIGQKCFEVLKGRETMCPDCAVAEVYRTKDPTYRIIPPEDDEFSTEERSFEVFAYPITDEHGELYGAVELTRDITDRVQTEEQIKASLREKEILLREIHHRVKNNLQIVSTLLYLQSGYIKDKKACEMIKESQNRIKSMALIHDKLYQFKDLGKIDFTQYIRDLIADLFHSYGVSNDGIKLEMNVYDVLLDVNTAIPCGLLINELVSNALKHAFPDGKDGEIRVALTLSEGGQTFTLRISDNGIGFPEDLDFQNTSTLGLQLVIALVEQLNGTIELDRSSGTEFKITFAKSE